MAHCEECNGSGSVECYICGTDEALDCDECSGTGEVDDLDSDDSESDNEKETV